MFSPAEPIGADFEAAAPSASILSWVAKNSSKPGREPAECWVIHASPEFSAERLEDSPEQVAQQLVQEFARLFGIRSLKPSFLTAHRWRYARPMATAGQPFLYDNELRLGACGDWCIEARVEGAFLSGEALAGAISAQYPSGWFGSFRVRYFSEAPLVEDNSVESGGSTIANLALGWSNEVWRVQLDVLNLFDSDDHDIDYFYASRLPGEGSDGLEDVHFHVFEPRQVRVYLSRDF